MIFTLPDDISSGGNGNDLPSSKDADKMDPSFLLSQNQLRGFTTLGLLGIFDNIVNSFFLNSKRSEETENHLVQIFFTFLTNISKIPTLV